MSHHESNAYTALDRYKILNDGDPNDYLGSNPRALAD